MKGKGASMRSRVLGFKTGTIIRFHSLWLKDLTKDISKKGAVKSTQHFDQYLD